MELSAVKPLIEEYSCLDKVELFTAGAALGRTKLKPETLLKFVGQISSMRSENLIDETTKQELLELVYKGELGKAKAKLNLYSSSFSFSVNSYLENSHGEESTQKQFGAPKLGRMNSSPCKPDDVKFPVRKQKPTPGNPEEEKVASRDSVESWHFPKRKNKPQQEDFQELPRILKAKTSYIQKEMVLCSLCNQYFPMEEWEGFGSCEHIFHKKCIADYVSSRIKDKVLPVNCPICSKSIPEKDLGCLLSPEQYGNYVQLSVSSHYCDSENKLIFCPNQTCKNGIEIHKSTRKLKCPMCKIVICAVCESYYHRNSCCGSASERNLSKSFGLPRKTDQIQFRPGK